MLVVKAEMAKRRIAIVSGWGAGSDHWIAFIVVVGGEFINITRKADTEPEAVLKAAVAAMETKTEKGTEE